jgi:hypothetical protein
MYAKTNPRAVRISPRQKRIFAITAVVVVVLFGGLAAWGAMARDTYGTSAHGCVNVTVPNSTGGSVLHYCGSRAQSFCQASFRSRDQVSLRARPQCALAGLSPSARLSPAADPSTAAS